MKREQAIEIAQSCAKAKPQSYYAEPFQPHEWVIDAIQLGVRLYGAQSLPEHTANDRLTTLLTGLRGLRDEWRELARELELPVEGIPAHIRMREGARVSHCAAALDTLVRTVEDR